MYKDEHSKSKPIGKY